MAAAALPLALSPLGGGEGGGDTTPPTKIQRGPPGCCSPTKRRRRRPRSGPRPLRRTLTTGAANFPLFFRREDPHPIHRDPPLQPLGLPPCPPASCPPPSPHPPMQEQPEPAGRPPPRPPAGAGGCSLPLPQHRSSNAEPAARPPPAAHGGGGAALAPSPKYPGCSSPPQAPLPLERGGGAGGGGCRQPSPLPRRESSNANPPGAAEAQSGPHLLGSPEESRSQRGQGLQRGPASPWSFIAFLTPTPRTRSTLSLAGRARRRHCGGGKGYSGNSSVRKCPPLGSGWVER